MNFILLFQKIYSPNEPNNLRQLYISDVAWCSMYSRNHINERIMLLAQSLCHICEYIFGWTITCWAFNKSQIMPSKRNLWSPGLFQNLISLRWLHYISLSALLICYIRNRGGLWGIRGLSWNQFRNPIVHINCIFNTIIYERFKNFGVLKCWGPRCKTNLSKVNVTLIRNIVHNDCISLDHISLLQIKVRPLQLHLVNAYYLLARNCYQEHSQHHFQRTCSWSSINGTYKMKPLFSNSYNFKHQRSDFLAYK